MFDDGEDGFQVMQKWHVSERWALSGLATSVDAVVKMGEPGGIALEAKRPVPFVAGEDGAMWTMEDISEMDYLFPGSV